MEATTCTRLRISAGALVCLAAHAAASAAQTIGAFPEVAVPAGNPLTPEKVLLGKALFFEEQLSSDNTMACATCHLPEAGGSDVRAGGRAPGLDGIFHTLDDEFGSPGVIRQDRDGDYRRHNAFGVARQATDRHAPTVYGAAFFETLLWDMSAGPVFRDANGAVLLDGFAALENQAIGPPTSAVEMAHEARTWAQITAKLAAARPLDLARDVPAPLAELVRPTRTYRELFERVFGTPDVTRERIAMALASYQRTLVPDRTPFDLGTMTAQQALGFDVFRTKGTCTTCHHIDNGLFSDGLRHTLGLPGHPRGVKTPTLRNVGLQRRLMSSGQLADLDEALAFYAEIGVLTAVTPSEREALLDFLGNALTDERVLRQEPPFDRPRLRSELASAGAHLFGEAWPGTDGAAPELLAETPANLGNAGFKLGVANGRPGALALLLVGARSSAPGSTFRGAPLHVDLAGVEVVTRVLGDAGVRRGLATFRLPLPADPALLGARRVVQVLVLDPEASGGVAATRGAKLELFSERGTEGPLAGE
jgi:cytochrome c peroxidase